MKAYKRKMRKRVLYMIILIAIQAFLYMLIMIIEIIFHS